MIQLAFYVLFLLSGAAGLMYESIWTRYLGLFVGHSAYAQIIVLTIYLGGMALGAALVGRRSESVREPLRWYALAEIVVGVLGLVFHDVYGAVTSAAYASLFPALAGGALLAVAKWAIVGLLILPQAVLLGTTFPLMSSGLLRLAPGRPGRTLAILYFTNSLGAAVGVLVAGFYTIRTAGLPGTLLAAAILNLVVGVASLGIAAWMRGRQGETAAAAEGAARGAAPQPAPTSANGGGLAPARVRRLLLAATFGTAVASFVYEIAWTRMLSLVLGSSTHSFELMLSAFILGLALGALWMHRRADRFADPIRALAVVQWLMGFAALATLPVYLASFSWTAALITALQNTDRGYALFSLVRYGFALAVMLPATFFAGMTLPLITRTLIDTGHGERSVGTVYAVNTVGSIVGVGLAGLLLLPALGLKALLIGGAVVDMGIGVLLLYARAERSPRARLLPHAAAAGVVAVAALAALLNHFDRALLTSGVFRYGRVVTASSPGRNVVFYRDGRTASVSVTRFDRQPTNFNVATNGKPDGSVTPSRYGPTAAPAARAAMANDEGTQILLPLVALAHAPNAATAAVIGHGTGMSSHALLASPKLRELYTIEIEPQIVAASRVFHPANRRVFDDPRSHEVIDDAKSFFAASPRRYDVILSEPSNPWVSGVAGLFTAEFYGRVRGHLAPGGVFAQWLHLYEINDQLVLSVLAALHQAFPGYAVYAVGPADIVIVAVNRPTVPAPDWSVFELPGIRSDLAQTTPFTARSLDASWLANRAVLAPLLDGWAQPNSDYYPVLDLEGERARFSRGGAEGFLQLGSGPFDLVAALAERRSPFAAGLGVPVQSDSRTVALALGSLVRAQAPDSAADPEVRARYAAARQRAWRFEAALAHPAPPPDWSLWFGDALANYADRHGGTAGVADEAFFAQLRRYVEARNAPASARDAVAFLHGLSAWDFREASAAADRLYPAVMANSAKMPPDLFRDGAVVAKLKVGDVAGARRILDGLAARTARRPGDVRNWLLTAQVLAAEARLNPARPGAQSVATAGGR